MAVGFGTTSGSGSTDRIRSAVTGNSTIRSYAGFLRFNALTNNMRMFDKNASFLFYSSLSVGRWIFEADWTTANGQWYTTSPVSTGTWYHIGVVYDSSSTANDPTIYVNGSSVTVTELTTPSGTLVTNSSAIDWGNRNDSARVLDGMLHSCAVWDGALSAEDFAALADGASPALIRPDILASHLEMTNTATGGLDPWAGPATVTGTANQAHSKGIIRRSAQILQFPPAPAVTFNAALVRGSNIVLGSGGAL